MSLISIRTIEFLDDPITVDHLELVLDKNTYFQVNVTKSIGRKPYLRWVCHMTSSEKPEILPFYRSCELSRIL